MDKDRIAALIAAAKWFYALPDLKVYGKITREMAFQELAKLFPEHAGGSPEEVFKKIAATNPDEFDPLETEREVEEKPIPKQPIYRYFKDSKPESQIPDIPPPAGGSATPGLGTVVKSRLKYYILAGVLLIAFVMYIADDLAPLMFDEGEPDTALTSGSSLSSAIDYCSFTYRGKQVAIKSRKLVSIFQEVSAITKVPASVLASVAVHESPVFALGAEDAHDAFTSSPSGVDCLPHFPTSPTGALGLMQIQAPSSLQPKNAPQYNPNAFSKEGVGIGLKFLNRSLDSLTTRDFCDIKTNIILGAGVLIAKNGGTAPQTLEEIKESVCRYYGVCNYGEFNYGDEVAGDFNNCRPSSSPQLVSNQTPGSSYSCPIPSGTITCGSFYNPINSCGHCGLNYNENMSICNAFPATKYAIDIAASAGDKISLPSLGQQNIKWDFDHQEAKATDAIQIYRGTDLQLGKKYILQLHHTQPGSGDNTGAKICSRCNHVHVQIGESASNGAISWLDSANYLCKKVGESV